MNSLPEQLTKEETSELRELGKKIFGNNIFVVIEKIDREKPEVKRYEELVNKKKAHQSAKNKVLAQIMWN